MTLDALFPSFRTKWVLHADADIVVVDKPPFMATHAPDPGRADDAFSRLARHFGDQGESRYLGIHQRLDRDTSGVLLFSRRKEANASLARQFEGRTVKKRYVAVVSGELPGREGTLRHRLVPDGSGRMRTARSGGDEAITRYRVRRREGTRVLVDLEPETGRTHQLRVQLAAVGAPIVGDTTYDGEPGSRLFLHATELALEHPGTGRPVRFAAPTPASFEAAVAARSAAPFESVAAIEQALRDAADRRYGIALDGATTAFRVANGAGDGLPGVTVDAYDDWLVVGLSGDGAEAARDQVLDAAMQLEPRGVYVKVRPKHASVIVDPRGGTFAPHEAARGASAPATMDVRELGLAFRVRLGEGLQTGIFVDQRANRRLVRDLAAGKNVLNLFAYTGAFTVAAIAGGSPRTVTVDASKNALAWARENLDAMGAGAGHELVEADALVWLRLAARKTERFDLAILDPPSFATTKTSRFTAAQDYRSTAAATLALLVPGGKLLACTNHRGIVRAKLRRYLHEAARDAHREVVQMKDLPDAVDFPAEPGREPDMKSVLVTVR